ncbi:MAG: carboxynorspermidine decarboxylase [Clostridiales bacterium GWF2_36_10]|nr:MAG: carboxynorspermidine decarboxylase [Clostridiales bacterium GWF2_36_10]HAN20593.1 carboxynorspermidine decarboxylase [Clostridiales bacterium]
MQEINFDINLVQTPYIIVDESLLIKNLEKLKSIIDATGCKILLAQKAFSMFSLYPLISEYLSGTTASGLFEAKLGYEKFGKENHVFSPAYIESEFDELLDICDHLIFNSFSQWEHFKDKAVKSGKSFGIRINPEFSTQNHAIYDPCSVGSRLGVTLKNFRPDLLNGISGLHFHTLCEQNSDALTETIKVIEEKFGDYLYQMEWVNFGGGHHITHEDYYVNTLIKCINYIKNKYNVHVYLEPGEAVALNTGFLVSSIIDIVDNGITNVILDTSAACHMPDVIEMPYRPNVIGAGLPNEKPYTYRFGGPTCLAGDIIGDYSFDKPLEIGDKVIFCDMAHYSMVKSNMFNGVNLPSIAIFEKNGNIKFIRSFGYDDYKNRLS